MRVIYKSPLLEEIFYLTPEFNDFKYPFLDDEILDEMIENTIFLPFGKETINGFTQKKIGKVFISGNLSHKSFIKEELHKIIFKICFKLNAIIQQQLKHYLKGLLFYNSFRYQTIKKLDSDLSEYKQESFYIDNIREIFYRSKNNKLKFKPVIDIGDRTDIYLYGSTLYILSIGEALKMHNKFIWNLSVLEHIKQFKENNKPKEFFETFTLDEIKNKEDLNDFIKEVFILFAKFYECDKITIEYNRLGFDKSKESQYQIGENQILIDYNIGLEKRRIKVPDTETDKKLLYLFEDY